MNIDLRFDDRHEARYPDVCGDFELLIDDLLDPGRVGLLDEGAHLSAEYAFCSGPAQQCGQQRDRFHQVNSVFLLGEAFIDF